MSVLSLVGVSRNYGAGATSVHALDGVTLTVDAGEFVAVMGPSGSGKSTLLAVAGGLDADFTGEVLLEGASIVGLSPVRLAELRRRHVGFVFQDYNLIPTLSVAENVAVPLELDGESPSTSRKGALVALTRVGIAALADRGLEEISGGERQRVALARAVVGERRLILADEPTGALDSAASDAIFGLLRELADEGIAVVVVTHEARLAAWADRIVHIKDGRIATDTSEGAR